MTSKRYVQEESSQNDLTCEVNGEFTYIERHRENLGPAVFTLGRIWVLKSGALVWWLSNHLWRTLGPLKRQQPNQITIAYLLSLPLMVQKSGEPVDFSMAYIYVYMYIVYCFVCFLKHMFERTIL